MPEKEPKFINQETEKSPQGAEDKMEEKEIEKSCFYVLKEALPLTWLDALRHMITQHSGRKSFHKLKEECMEKEHYDVRFWPDPPVGESIIMKFAGISKACLREDALKRIGLAKKYNLELEHFFCDNEQLRENMPDEKECEDTAEDMNYVNQFAQEFSLQSKRPILCLFNARAGTIFSYGMDTINTQFNAQFENLAQSENKSVQILRDEFVNDLKKNRDQQKNKKLAFMEVAQKWINEARLSYCCISVGDVKIPSTEYNDFNSHICLNRQARDIIGEKYSVLFVDTGSTGGHMPMSFGHMYRHVFNEIDPRLYPAGTMTYSNVQIYHRKFYENLDSEAEEKMTKLSSDDAVSQLLSQEAGCLHIFLDPLVSETRIWWDNFPQVLGPKSKKFGHQNERLYPTERIVQSAQQVEYLSEKVKNALRYYQKDDEGRNWFERNFEGIMLGKKDAPQKGTPEYLAMFRKWVPYETNEKGEAVLDDKGYPIPRKTAPMTVAAEDELARVEAAMGELER